MNRDNCFQLSYVDDGATRHIFVAHDSGKVIVDWYVALRNAKLQTLCVAFPASKKEEVIKIHGFFFSNKGVFPKTWGHPAYTKYMVNENKKHNHFLQTYFSAGF